MIRTVRRAPRQRDEATESWIWGPLMDIRDCITIGLAGEEFLTWTTGQQGNRMRFPKRTSIMDLPGTLTTRFGKLHLP